jgi:hypothetical protein
MNAKQTDLESNFRGQVIPVTKDSGKFIRTVLNEMHPYGLQVSMEDFVAVYGELLQTASGTGRSNPFHVSAVEGPCRVICAQCEIELDEPTIAALGTNSAMAAFGFPPVTQCRECGSTNAVIVST